MQVGNQGETAGGSMGKGAALLTALVQHPRNASASIGTYSPLPS